MEGLCKGRDLGPYFRVQVVASGKPRVADRSRNIHMAVVAAIFLQNVRDHAGMKH